MDGILVEVATAALGVIHSVEISWCLVELYLPGVVVFPVRCDG